MSHAIQPSRNALVYLGLCYHVLVCTHAHLPVTCAVLQEVQFVLMKSILRLAARWPSMFKGHLELFIVGPGDPVRGFLFLHNHSRSYILN